MERTYLYQITYDFDEEASLGEIAASLLANERFIKEAVGVIGDGHPWLVCPSSEYLEQTAL